MKLSGRHKEISVLESLLKKEQPEFVAIYGRKRVGKTFLIREVLEFKASTATKNRVFNLINKSKNGQIKEKEQEELTHYLLLEHLMRLAKIRAYQMLHS